MSLFLDQYRRFVNLEMETLRMKKIGIEIRYFESFLSRTENQSDKLKNLNIKSKQQGTG